MKEHTNSQQVKLGFIGMGHMGSHMAQMPATAAAQQMYAAALAKGMDEDFSIIIQFMEELAGVSDRRHE